MLVITVSNAQLEVAEASQGITVLGTKIPTLLQHINVRNAMIVVVPMIVPMPVTMTATMPMQTRPMAMSMAMPVFMGEQTIDIGLPCISQAGIARVADPAHAQAGGIRIIVGTGLASGAAAIFVPCQAVGVSIAL